MTSEELAGEVAAWERGDFADGTWRPAHPECNHHHPVSDDHEWVDFGHGPFVANKRAVPLLRALHDLGLRTRTHHIAGDEHAFVSILLDPQVTAEVRVVHERDATRTQYNGMTEVLLSWQCPPLQRNNLGSTPREATEGTSLCLDLTSTARER